MLQVYACVALYAAIFAICTCIKILVYGLRTDPDLVNITDPWSFTKPGFYSVRLCDVIGCEEKSDMDSKDCLENHYLFLWLN